MKTIYSIKTIDGSRFDWESKDGCDLINEINDGLFKHSVFFGLPVSVTETKYFNIDNVVSIIEREVEEC